MAEGLLLASAGPAAAAPTVDAAKLKERLDALAQEETACESATREQIPAYQWASQVQIPAGATLLTAIRGMSDTGVLEYTFCENGIAVVAACAAGGTPPQTAFIEQDPEALRDRIAKVRDMIFDRKGEVYAEAKGLYELLVKPVEGALGGAKRLWVVADGALQLIPFGALIDGSGYAIAQVMPVASVPSLSLALADRGKRPKPEHSAVVIAAPDTGALPAIEAEGDAGKRGAYMPIRGAYMPIRGGDGVSTALTSMASVPLPGAKAEGEAVAQLFAGSVLLTGKDAVKQRLWDEGGSCDILHIATHGYVDPEVPEFSGLLLHGEGETPYEVLTAQDVWQWPLQARLVTLSACQTGLGRTVEGEGLLGLTRAFIYAGAQDVVCSLWPVSDESTAKLMTEFYKALTAGKATEDALTEAQRSLIADEKTRHPFYWAGFVAVRGPK